MYSDILLATERGVYSSTHLSGSPETKKSGHVGLCRRVGSLSSNVQRDTVIVDILRRLNASDIMYILFRTFVPYVDEAHFVVTFSMESELLERNSEEIREFKGEPRNFVMPLKYFVSYFYGMGYLYYYN
jgi:hypothetical protein